ncbi:MAG: response regulator transcription factor, partial [Chitinophagaceae bacterium]
CLIVDDEPIARKIIRNYIDGMPLLRLEAECINALAAIEYIRSHEGPYIIFLDINMPNLSGIQLVKILRPRQPVIFTTAYAEHAVESYELNAVDYLLKPFSFERFTQAVLKAVTAFGAPPRAGSAPGPRFELFIKSDGKNYPVCLDDILYCEARKNYTLVVLQNQKSLLPLVPLSKFEALLAEAGGAFIQVHRSYLVARKHIRSIGAQSVTVGQYELPIGVQFRERFLRAIGMREEGE